MSASDRLIDIHHRIPPSAYALLSAAMVEPTPIVRTMSVQTISVNSGSPTDFEVRIPFIVMFPFLLCGLVVLGMFGEKFIRGAYQECGSIMKWRPQRAKELLLRHRTRRRRTSLCSADGRIGGCRFRNIPGLVRINRGAEDLAFRCST